EIERARRSIGRIAIDRQERIDRAASHVGRKRGQRLRFIAGGDNWLAVPDRSAGIVQLTVDRSCERLPSWIELGSDGQQRAALMTAQLARSAIDPFLLLG